MSAIPESSGRTGSAIPQCCANGRRYWPIHYDANWEWMPQAELRQRIRTTRYHDGLFERQAFHFHPLKYAQGIAHAAKAQGVAIHERSPVTGLQRVGAQWRVTTPQGEVLAKEVVLACGGYLAGLRRAVDAAYCPSRHT
jgi:gamma-glutamylputrescine oxidase